MKNLVFWILSVLLVISIVGLLGADYQSDKNYDDLQECKIRLELYKEINNELIKRIE